MNEYAGINVRLSRSEFERLSAAAQADLRHPRDQARYLLRMALGLAESVPTQDKSNRTGEVYETQPSAVAP